MNTPHDTHMRIATAMIILLTLLACVGLLSGLLVFTYRLYHARRFRPTKEQRSTLLSQQIEDWEDQVQGKKCLQKWIMRARVQFGYVPEYNAANREAVRIWLRNEMRDENVRVCDMMAMIPLATMGPFIPWREVCQSHSLMSDKEVKRRRRAAPGAK